jgi:hypothetical protein
MSFVVKRRYTTSDLHDLCNIVARVFTEGFKTITVRPGEVVAELEEEPAKDPTLANLLAEEDLIIVPAQSRLEVFDLVWRHCNRLRLVPYCIVLSGKSAAEWLGVHLPTRSVFGIPVRRDASISMDEREFMVLLADSIFGPVKRVKRVIHGRVGEG